MNWSRYTPQFGGSNLTVPELVFIQNLASEALYSSPNVVLVFDNIINVETPTGAVDAVNQTFTVTATPKWIVSDGVVMFSGAGYSIAGLTVTIDLAPNFYIRAIS